MNYVEELITTVGVTSTTIAELGSTYNPYHMEVAGKLYPKFTGTKQLELIKLIMSSEDIIWKGLYTTPNKNHTLVVKDINSSVRFISSHEDFAQALAQLILKLVKESKLNKEKVKEIFEKWQ